jgi:hypothetical protein
MMETMVMVMRDGMDDGVGFLVGGGREQTTTETPKQKADFDEGRRDRGWGHDCFKYRVSHGESFKGAGASGDERGKAPFLSGPVDGDSANEIPADPLFPA